MAHGQLLRADGTEETVSPADGKTWTLVEIQRYVGGYIQIVESTVPGHILILDEEGKMAHKPINAAATELYPNGAMDPIVGDVIHCLSRMVD